MFFHVSCEGLPGQYVATVSANQLEEHPKTLSSKPYDRKDAPLCTCRFALAGVWLELPVGVFGASPVFAAALELLAVHALFSSPAVFATERFIEKLGITLEIA